MITNKEEYDHCKAQVTRQKEEITRTRQQMDALEILVTNLETEVNTLKDTYEPVKEPVEEPIEEKV